MLAGRKPLASFADGSNCFPEVMNRYLRLFDRPVADGRFVRRDHFSEVAGRQTYTCHRVLFALPGEEWRMQAMIDLMSADEPWTPEHERREGELLGYDGWMNDYWLDLVYKEQRSLRV